MSMATIRIQNIVYRMRNAVYWRRQRAGIWGKNLKKKP